MHHHQHHIMDQIPGKPGLFFIFLGGFFQIINKVTPADITFILGTIATSLAIIYYSILIIKNLKKKA